MKNSHRIKSALLAVFPTIDSLIQFTIDDDNYSVLQSLIAFAYEHQMIPKADKMALFDFVRNNTLADGGDEIPVDLNFELFFDQKETLLELNLSLRALTDHINNLLTTSNIRLPKVTNSMLSRLKREPADTGHKQNVLRSLAFWIGYYRGHLISQWNFESLSLLCRNVGQEVEANAGVRIGFALTGRGDAIDLEIVDWLKKNLKGYIENKMGHFNYGGFGKVRSYDISILHVDFPNQSPLKSPATYRQCLSCAISIAHQIAIRWALTPYCGQHRFLSIGIAAGEFATLGNYVLPLLNTRLPGDPVIRLTDFARQCVLVNDLRVELCRNSEEITLFNGENLTIWWVVGVWSTLYYDFVPVLLSDPLLKNDTTAARFLFSHLWGTPPNGMALSMEDKSNAIVTFSRIPHNALLGVEIAKTLFYRRRFWEAKHILNVLLSFDRTHIHARTLLMILYRSLALVAPNHLSAKGLFQQAQKEVEFIIQNCDYHSEDFYCEYAVLFLAEAMVKLRNLRNQNVAYNGEPEFNEIKSSIYLALSKADDLIGSGAMASSFGIRSHYLRLSVKIIQSALRNDEAIFTDPARPIDGPADVIRSEVLAYQWQYGLYRDDIPQNYDHEYVEKIFNAFAESHDDSIALQAYRPTTIFCTAVSWWDLFPIRTVGVAKRVIDLLLSAADIAEEMDKKGIGIYSFTRTYGEVIPAKDFIEHMARSIKMVENYCGGGLENRNQREIIKAENTQRLGLLMTLNF